MHMKKVLFILSVVALAACNNTTETSTQDTLSCDSTCDSTSCDSMACDTACEKSCDSAEVK